MPTSGERQQVSHVSLLISASLPLRTKTSPGGRRASAFLSCCPFLSDFSQHLRGGIAFHQPSSGVPTTIVITLHPLYLLFHFLLSLHYECLFSHKDYWSYFTLFLPLKYCFDTSFSCFILPFFSPHTLISVFCIMISFN